MGMYVCVVFSLCCAVHVHLCISTSLLPIFDKVPSYQAIEITDWRERERKGKGGERERKKWTFPFYGHGFTRLRLASTKMN